MRKSEKTYFPVTEQCARNACHRLSSSGGSQNDESSELSNALAVLKKYDTKCKQLWITTLNQLTIITDEYVLNTTRKPVICLLQLLYAIRVTTSLIREHSSTVDLELLKQSRAENRSMALLQLEDAQSMNGETIKDERESLRDAVLLACKESDTVTLGIMAESGGRAVRTLQAWVSALQIPRYVRRKNLLYLR